MIAALPMYDWPEERAGVDALWSYLGDALREGGVPAPLALTRGDDLWALWEDPGLVIGQTCGLPYRARLHDRVQLIGTFDYGLQGVPTGHYRSEMVVARNDPREDLAQFREAALALNGFDSQSGWCAAHAAAKAAGITFRRFHHTGAHRASAGLVAEGRADIAAVDAVTWRLIQRHEPDMAARLRVLGPTPSSPALPLVAAPGQPAGRIADILEAAVTAMPDGLRDRTGVTGFHRMCDADYLAVVTPPLPSQAQPVL
ncbi:phosphate/phosphite/phosphonate ABC transporter substrate-binding protein [Anianabacter salinae]|uniref:phosphate/phosphite/phosphonate ABC transporter substrate-binding protein n=1 Tax=Anianabacter salinae TaxID=2851023 RepID=UPI00225E5996|nr:PhnD/SsuA/transferrin family substrate-binding protein [Anianabacter salinae]MBV0912591.1 phosphate/phosphite/phosphonate ABC transporter substrate-binding protein [Anianabacter salinae]